MVNTSKFKNSYISFVKIDFFLLLLLNFVSPQSEWPLLELPSFRFVASSQLLKDQITKLISKIKVSRL